VVRRGAARAAGARRAAAPTLLFSHDGTYFTEFGILMRIAHARIVRMQVVEGRYAEGCRSVAMATARALQQQQDQQEQQ
jgi:hypothetical protein